MQVDEKVLVFLPISSKKKTVTAIEILGKIGQVDYRINVDDRDLDDEMTMVELMMSYAILQDMKEKKMWLI